MLIDPFAFVPDIFLIHALKLSPGSHLLMENVSWEQYDALLNELDEELINPRINYCHNTIRADGSTTGS